MINRNNKATKSVGKVEMTLEAYNEMIVELEMYRQSMNVVANDNYIRLNVNMSILAPVIRAEVKNNFPKYKIDEYYINNDFSTTLGNMPEEDAE